MKIIRFKDYKGNTCYGTDYDGRSANILSGDPLGGVVKTDDRVEVKKILAPIDPVNILCIGLNYRKHIQETKLPTPKFPVLFMKNTASLAHPFDEVVIPASCSHIPQVDYEVELAVIIGRDAKNVKEVDAHRYIAGYTVANDISARTVQFENGGQWVLGKSFDTFCPLGPCMVKGIDPDNLSIKTELNGKLMQESNTSDMLFSPAKLIELLSCDMTLLKGTVILTGTPSGVGFAQKDPVFLKDGDRLDLTIEKIGTLTSIVKG